MNKLISENLWSRFKLVIVLGTGIFIIFTSNFSLAKIDTEYNLSVSAKLVQERGKETVFINGETNLPDNTKLYIFLKSPERTIASRKVYVKDGVFTTKIKLLESQKVISWDYVLEAVLWPSRQEDEKVIDVIGRRGEKITNVGAGKIGIFKETNEKILKASYVFRVGSLEDKEEKLSKLKQDLRADLKKLSDYYYALEDKYSLYKRQRGDFDIHSWQDWF